MPQAERNQAMPGIGDHRRARVADQRGLGALFQFDHQFRRARQFIVRVIADQFLVDAVMLQQLLGLPCIFAGDQVGFFQNADRAQRNVFEVPDRCRHQVQATASCRLLL